MPRDSAGTKWGKILFSSCPSLSSSIQAVSRFSLALELLICCQAHMLSVFCDVLKLGPAELPVVSQDNGFESKGARLFRSILPLQVTLASMGTVLLSAGTITFRWDLNEHSFRPPRRLVQSTSSSVGAPSSSLRCHYSSLGAILLPHRSAITSV